MDTEMLLPTLERNGYQLGLSVLIAACGDKDMYDTADHARAGLAVWMSCTRCTGTMAGAAARLYRRGDGSLAAYCGACSLPKLLRDPPDQNGLWSRLSGI
jgi:hypothetical protein